MADDYSAKPTVKKASPQTQTQEPSPKYKFEGHSDAIQSFVFLHDNKHIVSGSWDGTMRKWDCETGLLVGEPWEGEGGEIWALALSPNGKIIACGRKNGSVQQWNTDGKMIKDVWMGHSSTVRSLSWSPRGGHIASGSHDGTILIRRAENGKVEVGPIETGQDRVCSLAYSPSGDRIASGGNKTICIWDSNTGELLVGPIKDLGSLVTSVVWSSDSSKLYSASDKFARVFDSVSGTQLHRFEHNRLLYSVALSPKHNVLACVGFGGIAQLWDTESYQPLGKPFGPGDRVYLYCVSFSRDGRHLAYSGDEKKITLWIVKDISGQLEFPAPTTEEETLPEPAPLSYDDVNATDPFAQSGANDLYDNFFSSSHSSLPSPSSGPSPTRRLWGVFVVPSRLRTPTNDSVRLQERLKRYFLTRRARSPPSPLEAPAKNEPTDSTPDGKVKAGEERNKDVDLPDCSVNMTPGAAEQNKGKQREELADAESLPPDDASPVADFDTIENRTFWKFLRAQGKNATMSPAHMAHGPSPKVVEVYANRVSQGYVAWKRKHKAKSSTLMTVAPTPATQASGSSQLGSSSHGYAAHGHISSLGQAGVSSQSSTGYGVQSLQVAEGLNIHCMDDLSDSDSIQGSWNRFLDKICFPCGHYEDH